MNKTTGPPHLSYKKVPEANCPQQERFAPDRQQSLFVIFFGYFLSFPVPNPNKPQLPLGQLIIPNFLKTAKNGCPVATVWDQLRSAPRLPAPSTPPPAALRPRCVRLPLTMNAPRNRPAPSFLFPLCSRRSGSCLRRHLLFL